MEKASLLPERNYGLIQRLTNERRYQHLTDKWGFVQN